MFGIDPMFLLKMATAGLWAEIWHWGTGFGLIILCLLGAWLTTSIPFIGPYLKDARKDFLYAAACIAIFMGGQALGEHDANRVNAARQKVVEQHVDKVVKTTATPKYRKMQDRWDNPEN